MGSREEDHGHRRAREQQRRGGLVAERRAAVPEDPLPLRP
jgi:hypothetical protein